MLSAGGGKAFSVRSSKLSQKSMLTPATKISVSSSIFESRKSLKSTVYSSQRSKVSSLKPQRIEALNQSEAAAKERYHSSEKSKVLYPHLQAFIDRGMGKRPGKRIIFDNSEYEDLIGGL